ncbi:MAG: phosphotransferase [Bacteroidota bacterium]
MSILPIIPGRGLVTKASTQLRIDFLDANSLPHKNISESTLDLDKIQNNIESYIGTVEIPVGVVGPLLFKDEQQSEFVYCTAGTLEGALVASMNRGVRAISLSGGFSAKILWQKMCRAPLFLFENEDHASLFAKFTASTFEKIKVVTKKYSNHAQLQEIKIIQQENHVHLKFIYSTGDASGQNMTTTCTWHAILYLIEEFNAETTISPLDFVIEGNASSDKKISYTNIREGRGIHVVAECFLSEKIIREVLRTTSEKMENFFQPSIKLAKEDGMVGYNINVANAIASIFVATGQDLASIHESGVGILNLKRNDSGLLFQLALPNLVIGTIGGGTHLSKQSEALAMMGCLGTGKVERFAQLIAGYALGLEISTYSAIVSGEFAKAHEKLGRNKPKQWLLKSELTPSFLLSCIEIPLTNPKIEIIEESILENGIITNVAAKISKKLMGFTLLKLEHGNQTEKLILKSKPLDEEIIKGLHMIAASIDPTISDLIKEYRNVLEYKNCHIKEIEINQFLHSCKFNFIPRYYGQMQNDSREIYFFIQEFLDYSRLAIVNSENNPEIWQKDNIKDVLSVISEFHSNKKTKEIKSVPEFSAWKALPLYAKLLSIIITEKTESFNISKLKHLLADISSWEAEATEIKVNKVVIHNDFNPRNIAIRKNKAPVIYDWELAVIDFPSRDVVEFLSFIFPSSFTKEEMYHYLNYYSELNKTYTKEEWNKAYKYSLKTYIATRLAFYEVAGILIKYDFSNRVLNVALRMLDFLEEGE